MPEYFALLCALAHRAPALIAGEFDGNFIPCCVRARKTLRAKIGCLAKSYRLLSGQSAIGVALLSMRVKIKNERNFP